MLLDRVLAHVKWYVDGAAAIEWEFLFHPMTLSLLVAAAVAAVLWRVAAARLHTPELPVLSPLSRLVPWVPRLLAIHLGVSLLSLAVADAYLSPNLSLGDVPGGWLIAFSQGVIGVWLITGVGLRIAGLLVIALGPLGLLLAGPVPVLESVDLLGLAVFIVMLPPGRDEHGARATDQEQLFVPLLALRVAAGVALIVLAFSEKLLVPDLPRGLLEARPYLDPLQQLGLTSDPDLFIRVASATEFLIGLLVISGAAPQLAVILAGIPFNVTLIFFDRYELIGHLPVYGVLLALLVYGSSPQLAPVVPRFSRPAHRNQRQTAAAASAQ